METAERARAAGKTKMGKADRADPFSAFNPWQHTTGESRSSHSGHGCKRAVRDTSRPSGLFSDTSDTPVPEHCPRHYIRWTRVGSCIGADATT